jgi:hypothetical protein
LRLNSLIGSLPGYWLFFEAVDLCLLPSKSPVWLQLYSTPKACAILALFFSSWLAFRYLSPLLVSLLVKINLSTLFSSLSPIRFFVVLAIFCRLVLLGVPCSVGEDVALQTLSAKQWVEGHTTTPNLILSPDPNDLSASSLTWIPRPPGVSWLVLPGLLIGLPIGYSIQIMLFLLYFTAGIGWLKLAKSFSISPSGLHLLASLLSIYAAIGSLNLSTASVFTTATFPWLILWALKIGNQWNDSSAKSNQKIWHLGFFAAIGSHAFFKLSSLLTLSGILILPFLISLLKSRKVSSPLLLRASIATILFLGPYFLLSSINKSITGASSNELYSKQDYNAQHALWGKHFIESTRGGMLATSFLASLGYATPVQGITHRFRDFLLQFDKYSGYLHGKGINSLILGCCILSIPISLIILISLFYLRSFLTPQSFLTYLSLISFPFLGLAVISFHHGYNYLIYHAYTKEFSNIFVLFGLSFLMNWTKISLAKPIGKILVATIIALPMTSAMNSYCTNLKSLSAQQNPSEHESREKLGSKKFSKSLENISKDSQSASDVCWFLCAGDYGDHSLRTPLRSLSLHFAKDNIQGFSSLNSSNQLKLYCLIDPLLVNDQAFIKTFLSKLPETSVITRLDSLTWKVEFKGLKS